VDFEFLSLDDVLVLHEDRIHVYGGSTGLRDLGLLESALAMPQATFDGNYLHETPFAMAAAYLFHVARNHPFVDGNKRTALACALVFLRLNGVRTRASEAELYELVIGTVEGRTSKAAIAVFFEEHVSR
jgi:death-on-curing protein